MMGKHSETGATAQQCKNIGDKARARDISIQICMETLTARWKK
jgi:hypothetical protein